MPHASENCSQRKPCGWERVGLSRAVSRAMWTVTPIGSSAHHGSSLVVNCASRQGFAARRSSCSCAWDGSGTSKSRLSQPPARRKSKLYWLSRTVYVVHSESELPRLAVAHVNIVQRDPVTTPYTSHTSSSLSQTNQQSRSNAQPQGGGSPMRSAILAASSSEMSRTGWPPCISHAFVRSALQATPCPTSAPAS